MEIAFKRQGLSLEVINPDEIPEDATFIDLSNNNFLSIPPETFISKTKVFKFSIANNILTDLSFLRCFEALVSLDISSNQLEIDELLQIRHIYIIFLNAQKNSFVDKLKDNPLTLIIILKRAWIINGTFVTDYARQIAKQYKKTLEFGESILNARREKLSEHNTASTTQAAKHFLIGTSFKFQEPGKFITPSGRYVKDLANRPQIEKLKYLHQNYPIDVPTGTFSDYFAIILGILSYQWMNVPISTIPRLLSRGFWGTISSEISDLEEWRLWVLLYHLSQQMCNGLAIENELWQALKVINYIKTGVQPTIGSIPRLIVAAFLFRAMDPSELQDCKDIIIYQNLRQKCNFTSLDESLETIHKEILGNLPVPDKHPEKGETIAVIHPLTKKWINCKASYISNGRIFAQLPTIILHLPLNCLFWDGRGVWRQMDTVDKGIRPKTPTARPKSAIVPRLSEQARNAFITASKTDQNAIASTIANDFHVPISLVDTSRTRIAPSDSSKEIKKVVLPVFQTMARPEPVKTTAPQPKTMPRDFRGIVDPYCPKTPIVHRKTPSRPTNQVIQNVVNVCLGHELRNGTHLRKFHAKVYNELTKKVKYVWINEDEISPADVDNLCALYRSHIQKKMDVIHDIF
ncbi:hypothetical protein TVAG_122640 [Trichomonas vaginalis G3]|uniref:Leucine Rich Repeat family protein n=1 Tax=Trichomonas vaginalis (strain ATCC PRA-98 / G3) TaxID=412133 RepID=A2DN21_TRIV3|nr:outer arm dynein light chain 1 family [Trichomonas vaginalis G3]EAY18198.1 hypothetical protein TVAG_122640 [Trichomonas vaginalis G3]KAI5491493.1 outer arm dynein light chain 1 family [Trichomonas vaginalis G3]|eukprot:XP_001579184.1 hypothetical protein [Trichomonas vaginalis G3]